MRPQGQNVVQREVVRTVYISVYSIQETSSLIVQHIVDEAKPYHSTHTLFSFIVVPSRHDGLYRNRNVFHTIIINLSSQNSLILGVGPLAHVAELVYFLLDYEMVSSINRAKFFGLSKTYLDL